jgi:gluconolactonase
MQVVNGFVEINLPEFLDLIDRDAAVEQVCTGFQFTEGPLWNPNEQCLYFSDMPGDVRRRWSAADGVREVRRPSNKCNGTTYDGVGNLYICEHTTSMLVMETPTGQRKVLASHWQGLELNSPNDVVVRSDGSVYFSDPTYGRMPVFGLERKQALNFQGVFRIPPNGALHCEARDPAMKSFCT